ncbi:MAG: DUF4149 domain-containing protein [Firmicutes bacterium]|nr:DUF4149 domain-containing protein [Bacillota bacterium]
MSSVRNALWILSLGFWVGASAYFTFFATSGIFAALGFDRGGAVLAVLFPRYYLAGTIALGIALLMLLWRLIDVGRPTRALWVVLVLIGLSWVFNLVGEFYLLPQTDTALHEMQAGTAAASSRFATYHGISLGMNVVELFMSAIALIVIGARPQLLHPRLSRW